MSFIVDLRPEWHCYGIPDHDVISFTTNQDKRSEGQWTAAMRTAFKQVGIRAQLESEEVKDLLFCPVTFRYKQ